MKLGVYQVEAAESSLQQRCSGLQRQLLEKPVDLVVCPELFVTGYHLRQSHRALASPVQGAYFDALSAVAAKTSTAIVYGYPELWAGDTYNSAAFVDEFGTLLANHRKRRASPNSFEVDTFANGGVSTVVQWQGFTIALLICYEVELPEYAREAALSGADLLAVPTALIDQWGIVAEKLIASRAFENGVWLAYANYVGRESSYRYLGKSRIVTPTGIEAITGSDSDAELLVAEIDQLSVHKARARLPYLNDAATVMTELAGNE